MTAAEKGPLWMRIKQYRDEKAKIEGRFYSECAALDLRFAESNNPYKVGDVIEDVRDGFRIRIESWGAYMAFPMTEPELWYHGPRVRKSDGNVFTKCLTYTIYQHNARRCP